MEAGWGGGGVNINGGMKESKVRRSPAADRKRQRGDGATMFEVPREIQRMRRGAKARRPSSRVRGARCVPARLGELPCGAQQFYSTLLLQEQPPGEEEEGGW